MGIWFCGFELVVLNLSVLSVNPALGVCDIVHSSFATITLLVSNQVLCYLVEEL